MAAKKQKLMTTPAEEQIDFSAEPVPVQDTVTLRELTEKCEYLEELDRKAAELEEQLDKLKNEISGITNAELPELFQAIGLAELKLASGRKVTLLPFYSAKIPEENKPVAFAWLEEHNHDGIIKATVEMTFGKGEEEKKQEKKVCEVLKKMGIIFEHDRKIHPQTLKAFVREMVESGEQFPLETFGAYVGKVVKIK